MDLSFSEKDRAFQAEVRSFLDEAWPQEMRDKQSRSALGKLSKEDLVGWQKRLAAKGWAATNWPKEYGGGGLPKDAGAVAEEVDSRPEWRGHRCGRYRCRCCGSCGWQQQLQ